MIRFWKKLANIYIIPVLMCAATLLLANVVNFYRLPVLLVGIVIYTILNCLLNWRFTMNDYEKSLVTGYLKKRRSSKR